MVSQVVETTVSVGWILAADVVDATILRAYYQARDIVLRILQDQFPEFSWEMPFVERRVYMPLGALDPLPLAELGAEEKIYRHWDYAIVLVPNELNPRHRIFTLALPSSALEVAVVSSARLGHDEGAAERLAALVLHELGHLWGLDHAPEGPMVPPAVPEQLQVTLFPREQQEAIIAHLRPIADARLEEQQPRWNIFLFYIRTFFLNPREILLSIWGYTPWRMPLYLGRLTAAAAISTIFLLLTAEAWEVGSHLPGNTFFFAPLGAILLATLALFFGQNMGQVTREIALREQAARTRIVLFGTLLLGMSAVWGVIYVISLLIAFLLPRSVLAQWAGINLDTLAVLRYANFMATVGVLAAALGGNLEEEGDIKAEVLFDEET